MLCWVSEFFVIFLFSSLNIIQCDAVTEGMVAAKVVKGVMAGDITLTNYFFRSLVPPAIMQCDGFLNF